MASSISFVSPVMLGDDEEVIDLRMIGSIFRRRLPVFLVVTALVLALAAAFIAARPNVYSSSANVLLDRQKLEVIDADPALSDLPKDSASVDTEVQILRSPSLLLSVARKLELDKSPVVQAVTGASAANLARALGTSGAGTEEAQKHIVDFLQEALSIDRKGLIYVIVVTAASRDSQLSSRIANGVAEAYIQRQIDLKRAAAREAQDFLRSRLSGLGTSVRDGEATAESARARAGLPLAQNQETYDQSVILDTSKTLVGLEFQLAENRGRLTSAIRGRSNPAALPAVIESAVIRDLKSKRAEALARNADVMGRYGPNHPETRRNANELRQLDEKISAEMQAIIASLQQEVYVAAGRVAAVRGQLASHRNRAVANSRNTAAVQQIDREVQASRTVYEDFLRRSKETAQTEDLASAAAVLVSRAIPSRGPSAPNRFVLGLFGLAAALGTGLIATVCAELLGVKISTPHQIRTTTGVAKVVSVPKFKRPRELDSHPLIVVEKPQSAFTEAFRDLGDHVEKIRSKVIATDPHARATRLMITSSRFRIKARQLHHALWLGR
jgi:uncharacterized protein involved in exopolysaccharide biosynthesis